MKIKNLNIFYILIFFVLMIQTSIAQCGKKSPWDHNQLELKKSVELPIHYPKTFKRERQMFGYNPRFVAQKITFTPDNTPIMRFGMQGKKGEHRMPYASKKATKKNYIQFLSSKGKWRVLDSHAKSLRKFLGLSKKEELLLYSGERVSDMVEFDNSGNAYTVVEALVNGKKNNYLLFSKNKMKTWQVLELPEKSSFLLEADIYHNNRENPPVLLVKSEQNGLSLFSPSILKNGKLKLGNLIRLAQEPKAIFRNVMAGAGNATVTVDNKTFIVYMVAENREGRKGTPQYIISYNHLTKEVSKPQFLGESGHRIDGHNAPAIAVDSNKILHILLGTHWHSMVYLTSKSPANALEWNEPKYIEGNGNNEWSRNGLTYPGLIIDQNNTIHLTVRGRNSKFVHTDPNDASDRVNFQPYLDYSLIYIRKKENGEWESRKDLVTPGRHKYSNWYHKISIDKKGNIYLSYLYYAHNLSPEENLEYQNKWKGEDPQDEVSKPNHVKAHDPVLIHTYTMGDKWFITKTADLLSKMKK